MERRRVPRRWIVALVLLLLVGASERWDGPVTLAAIGRTTGRVVDAAATRWSSEPPGSAGEVHLTFDDGPSLTYTPEILDLLAEHDATAVFYPIGNQVPGGAALLQRAVTEGHHIGNHTWNHDQLRGIDDVGFELAVDRTSREIEQVVGIAPTCLRPPGGAFDDTTADRAAARGLTITLWTVDPADWRRPGSDEIRRRVLDEVDDGDIVLLHDGGGDRSQTVAALDRMLDELARRGFRFTAVPGC